MMGSYNRCPTSYPLAEISNFIHLFYDDIEIVSVGQHMGVFQKHNFRFILFRDSYNIGKETGFLVFESSSRTCNTKPGARESRSNHVYVFWEVRFGKFRNVIEYRCI
ncbi:hypothetical protein PBCV1_a684R [Paramecium bursaria Chlorella virus 1]|uniref:Uncharacterized protein n=1 Tax=Paramecium bursaria Chlorella virus 1 TaxID=10506 RepID=O41166_PBCV1|nr:hypothetical protein PBCV1_a684R [Paramecium bursaria Chlorella virus 1]AAC97055.1 hypothetical protein [Paramecium bursaria Chlorella virus 1]